MNNSIPNLLQRKERVQSGEESILRKVLIYGEPTTGKTELAATVALSPHIKRVFWFDLDKSLETVIFSPRISDEAREKIIPFDITGSNSEPYAVELFLQAFTGRKPKKLCYAHAKLGCPKCVGMGQTMQWSLYSLGADDAVVIDPGSKLSEYMFAYASMENETNNKIQWWGDFYGYMDNIQSALLDCPTNIIWISHELDLTKIVNKGTKQEREVLVRTVPICGSRNYSKKFSKDFGYKISTYISGSSFRATVTPGENNKAIVGARRPIHLYNDEGNPSLVPMFDPTHVALERQKGPATGLSLNLKKGN